MTVTNAEISFGLVDVTAKQDTTAEADNKQPFIDLQDLALEGVFAPKVATLEYNYWKLDGTYDAFPDNPEDASWGYWSATMSDSNGCFDIAPTLILSFAENHSSIALTFEFDPHENSYCSDINIRWCHGETLLKDMDFAPTSWKYSCSEKVENYNKIIINFRKTNRPCRYIKVQNIMHGVVKVFGPGEMKNAKISEEVDLTSGTLSVNTLSFTGYSADDDFNILNPQGIYNLLQKRQQLTVEGRINAERFNLGIYYVDDWKSANHNAFQIEAIDGIGVMGGTTFKGGLYTDKRIDELVAEIMEDAGFGYILDSSLKNLTISGWIPICSHREALQQVSFAIGAYVDTSRGGAIRIRAYPDISNVVPFNLPMSRKFQGTTVRLRPIVTGVLLTEHSYTIQETTEELFKDFLPAGLNEITFSQPSTAFSITGAAIVSSGVNYAVVDVAAPGLVTISGKRYVDNTKVILKKMAELPAGEKENIITITDATLVSSSNSAAVAAIVFNCYQNRIEQNLSFVLDREVVGSLVSVETLPRVFREAIVESMDIDLTGGFRAKAVVVGD